MSAGCARCRGSHDAVERLGTFDARDGAEEPALVASAVEFLLEGLHLQRRLNKDRGAPASRTGADRADAAPMAFLTPDPRHLDRTDRHRAPPRRGPRRRRRAVPGVGRLAGPAGPHRGRDRRRACRRPARAWRPGRGTARPDGPRVRDRRPVARRHARPARPPRPAPRPPSRAAPGGPARRPAGGRPAASWTRSSSRSGPAVQRRLDETEPGARGERPATAGRVRDRRPAAPADAPRRSPPSGSTASTRCRRTSARGSARSRTTTSSTATRGSGSRARSTSCARACSTG